MRILYHIGEEKGKNDKYKVGELCCDNKNIYINNGKGYICLDNIIKVEKKGNIFIGETIRIRNYSEYIHVAVPLAYIQRKKGKNFVILKHRETLDLIKMFENYKHTVRNPIYY